jgi:hypothetical protein
MPANKGGDSKQALIITLVCFVVLSLVLGLTTYFGYSGQKEFEDAQKDAKAKAAAMEKSRDWYKFQAVLLRNYAGYPAKNDANDLPVLRGKFDTNGLLPEGDEMADVTALVKTLDSGLQWDNSLKKPRNTFAQEVGKLNEELKNARARLDKAESELKKAKDDYAGMLATKETEVQESKKKFDLAQATNLKDREDREKELNTRLSEFGDLNKQLGEVKKKAEGDLEDRDKAIKKQENATKDLEKQIQKLRTQLTPVDVEKYSTPKGRVVRLDPKAEVAWIDLGSADNVRPQQGLTFSIFSSGAGGAEKIRKGAIEVMDVQGPHSSMARVTQVVDPYRNPIMSGDVLVNPAWTPSAREHVAIAGIIDLTGEGRDNIDEFMNNLKRQGVVIDAHLDLKDLTVKGEGMTMDTNYLILGKSPEYGQVDVLKEGDPRLERKNETMEKIAAMRTEAGKLGVTIVPLQKFVELTGYQLPKSAAVTPGFDNEIKPRETSAEPKEPAKRPERPAPKPEKKEEPPDK